VKVIAREVLRDHPVSTRGAWEATVRELWDRAGYREERYVALALLADRAYAGFRDPATMPLIDHLTVTGAWWDYVDVLAIRTVGPLVRAYPVELVPLMLGWARDGDLWRRRTAILHQVGTGRAGRPATDTDLLVRCIEPSLDRTEFFLRKAIGWALRDLAWHDPGWVQAYVRDHGTRLSGLSRREALKNCGPG
jgi:3-methyladenine DNA glycosylase AlkD